MIFFIPTNKTSEERGSFHALLVDCFEGICQSAVTDAILGLARVVLSSAVRFGDLPRQTQRGKRKRKINSKPTKANAYESVGRE